MTRRATTDANGSFVFDKLPGGDYTLSAVKAGYLETAFGAARPGPGMPGAFIRLNEGQRVDDVTFRIPRGSVIAGVVTDEFGDPAFGVPVRALRFGYADGGRMITGGGQAVTDDLGAYRIAGLQPGEYVVSAVPRDSVSAQAAAAESLRNRQAQILAEAKKRGTEEATRANFEAARRDGRDATAAPASTGYVSVFHPAAIVPSGGARLRLGVGQQLGAVDIQLQIVRTGSVSGTVVSAQGTPVAARVQLIDPSMPVANVNVWFRTASADGRFTFHGIPPGAYVVRAAASGEGGERIAGANVQVEEGGTHDVSLALRSGVSVSGAVDLATIPGANLRRMQVDLLIVSTAEDWETPLGTAVPDAEGRFVIRGVAPGLYRIGVRGLPDGWSLASATFADTEAADVHLRIEDRGVSGGILKFTNQTSELSGRLTTPGGDAAPQYAVLLFPDAREQWVPQSRRVRIAQPGPDGAFTISGLPPGQYRFAAVAPPEAGEQFDPEFLAQAVPGSIAVALSPGERKTQDLRIK